MYRGPGIKSIVPGYNLKILRSNEENFVFEVTKKKLLLGGSNACFFGEVDEFCDGFSLHLLHDPAAVDLDRLKGRSPLERDLFAQHPAGH